MSEKRRSRAHSGAQLIKVIGLMKWCPMPAIFAFYREPRTSSGRSVFCGVANRFCMICDSCAGPASTIKGSPSTVTATNTLSISIRTQRFSSTHPTIHFDRTADRAVGVIARLFADDHFFNKPSGFRSNMFFLSFLARRQIILSDLQL